MLEQKDYIVNRSWVEIDLNALAENLRSIRSLIRRNCEIMAVVKADGYGHGALQIAPLLLSCGASRLAVSLLDEAIHLRENGITAPILILSYTDPRRAEEIIRYNVTQTVYSWDLIHALNEAGRKTGRKADVHIKIDTGMSRIGFVSGFNSVHEAQAICALPNIVVEGIFTHFATADEADDHYLRLQFSRFMSICRELEKQGIYIPIKHCCNSAATLRYPEMHLDMVRTGLVMYGFLPDNCAGFATAVRPAMTLKSSVIHLKRLPAGVSVGYGRRYTTSTETTVATVPIGYADGYSRIMGNRAWALVRGTRVPVIGNICMDACMLDVSAVAASVQVGDEVILAGEQGGERVTFEELAAWSNTITYEMICIIGKRVPRVYLQDDVIVQIHSDVLSLR